MSESESTAGSAGAARALPRALELLVFALCFATYAFSWDREIGTNALAHFDQTVAIVESGTLSMTSVLLAPHGATVDWSSPDYPANGDLRAARFYPAKPPGLSFLGVPPCWVLSRIEHARGEDPLDPPVFERNARILTWLLASLPAALGSVLLLRFARALGASQGASTLGALAIALGSSYAPFASVLYLHALTGAALAGAGLLSLSGETTPGRAALAGFLGGLATAVSYQAAFAVLALGIAIAVRGRSARGVVFFALGGFPWLVFLLVVHALEFGSPFRTAYSCTNPAFAREGLVWTASLPDVVRAVLGLTVSPYRGFLVFSPVLGPALASAAIEARSGTSERRLAARAALAFLLASIALTATLPAWWGGASSGPRYLVPAFVLLAPFAAFAFEKWPRATAALLAISIANSLAVTFVSTTVDERVRNPLFEAIYPGLFAGQLGRSNAGMAFGLAGVTSLLPYFAAALALAIALRVTVRSAESGHVARP